MSILTNCSLKSWSTELPWVTVDLWRVACKWLCAFLRYNVLNISKYEVYIAYLNQVNAGAAYEFVGH